MPARQQMRGRHARVLDAVVATRDRERWLCDFLNSDLATVSDADLDRLRWEIQAFTYQRPGMDTGAAELVESATSQRRAKRSEHVVLDDAAAVRDVHRRLLDGCQELLLSGEWHVRVTADFALRRANDNTLTMIAGGAPEVAFCLAVCDLLQSLGSRFFVCTRDGCGRFFVARGRQFYCSPACSQAARTSRYNEKNPGLLAQHKHNAYKRRRQREHGKRVEVVRRPRSGA